MDLPLLIGVKRVGLRQRSFEVDHAFVYPTISVTFMRYNCADNRPCAYEISEMRVLRVQGQIGTPAHIPQPMIVSEIHHASREFRLLRHLRTLK